VTAHALLAAVRDLAGARDRVLVGIDGPECAGKSTLADELAGGLSAAGAGVLRVSVEAFHLPRPLRYRQGSLSGEGYFHDSFDYATLIERCLLPFRDGADRLQLTGYDYVADDHRTTYAGVPARAVMIVDGVFLLRAPLRPLWTLSVYLRVSPGETVRRGLGRDVGLSGSAAEVEERYRRRFLPGQELYRRECDPESAADIVLDNEHFTHELVRAAAPKR
jgi:uridine kinase